MKVITRCVNIENEEFVLISDVHNGQKYYGTIPYTELTEDGRMKRTMNGAEMAISFENASKALENRKRRVIQDRLIDKYIAEGMSKNDAIVKAVLNS